MTKILVTGATGFIGSHLVEYLLEDGIKPNEIRLFITSRKKLVNLPDKPFDVVVGDISNKKDVIKAIKGVKIVYHLATKTGDLNGNYDYLKETNVNGTRNLIESSVKFGVEKFIFFSSTAIYGTPGTVNIRNFDETYESNINEAYAQTKYEAENIIINACKNIKMKYIIIRPVHTYGPRGKSGIIQLIKAIKGGYYFFIGKGENKIDYIYVKDVVRIARELQKSKTNNEDFIVGPIKTLTMKNIVEIISKELNVNTPKLHVPKEIVMYASYIINILFNILRLKPILTPNGIKALTSDVYFNSQKLRKLGFKPESSFKEGVSETIRSIES